MTKATYGILIDESNTPETKYSCLPTTPTRMYWQIKTSRWKPGRWFHAQYSSKKVEEEKEKESWGSRCGTEDKLAIIIRAELEFLATLILKLDVKIVNRIVVLLTASLCHGINCCPAERGNIVPNPTWWRWWGGGGGGAGADMREL